MKLLELAQSPAPSLPADTTAWKAVEALRRSRAGALVVTQDGRLVGVLSERDLVHRVVGEGRDPRRTLVRDVMTRDPVATRADTSPEIAFEMMIAQRVRHLVLIDSEERPVGLVPLRVLAETQLDRAAETIQILQDYTNDSLGG